MNVAHLNIFHKSSCLRGINWLHSGAGGKSVWSYSLAQVCTTGFVLISKWDNKLRNCKGSDQKKNQGYFSWGMKSSRLGRVNWWICWDWKNGNMQAKKTYLDWLWYVDVHLTTAYRVKTVLFLVIRCMCQPVVNKPNCFVVHPWVHHFTFIYIFFLVR